MPDNFIYRATCAVCGKNTGKIIYSQNFNDNSLWGYLNEYYGGRLDKSCLSNGVYELAECFVCGFIWQTHVLNNELMELLYTTWISPEESLNKKTGAKYGMFQNYSVEVKSIPLLVFNGNTKKPGEIKVLDFGMGWGYWCLMAKAHGFDVSGYEISQKRLAHARNNGIKTINSMSELKDNKFDFINTTGIFEHIPDPRDMLEILIKCLEPGGVIRMSVPDGIVLKNCEISPRIKAIHPLEHINCFKHSNLIKFAVSGGLEYFRQPYLLSHGHNLRTLYRDLVNWVKRQYRGTNLYFRKPVK